MQQYLQMLKPEEDTEVVGRESAIDIGGPRSPPPYDIDEEPAVQQTTEITTTTNGHGATATAERSAPGRRKIQFNQFMAKKVQWIPTNRQGQMNTAFLQTVPGLMKLAEIIICFILWILAICSDRGATTSAWTEHISFECMIVVSVFLLGYVVFPHLTIKDEATREGLIVV
uniref:Uncharacterized protein n=1 Tax=Plectus sambesii TaxID=2011161 RepID=A0A914X484_9BILA